MARIESRVSGRSSTTRMSTGMGSKAAEIVHPIRNSCTRQAAACRSANEPGRVQHALEALQQALEPGGDPRAPLWARSAALDELGDRVGGGAPRRGIQRAQLDDA